MRLKYGLPLKRFPSTCGCWKPYNVQPYNIISCKKRRFVTLRYNELRNNIAELLEEETSGIKVEPALQPLSSEETQRNQSPGARMDISTRGFWSIRRRAFFNIWVFNSNAQCYQSKTLRKCYEMNEEEKKRIQSSDFVLLTRKFCIICVFNNRGNGKRMFDVC